MEVNAVQRNCSTDFVYLISDFIPMFYKII